MGDISTLIGTVLTSIDRDGDEALTFNTDSAKSYRMDHCQDCCESVTIEDICGDLDDLIGSPILQAEEATSDTLLEGAPEPENPDDQTEWTFYKLATIKGSVTIRWFGTSSGGYSTSVDFYEVPRVGLRYRVVEDIFAGGGERTIPVGSVVEVTEAGGGRYPRVRDERTGISTMTDGSHLGLLS